MKFDELLEQVGAQFDDENETGWDLSEDADLFEDVWPMPVEQFLQGNYLSRADIVLTRRSGDVMSWLIRWATRSHFSHAAMVFLVPEPRQGFQSTFVIEADRRGVDVTNIADFLRDPRTVVAIKRFDAPWFHEDIQKTVSGRLLNSIKSTYSYSKIWGLICQIVGQFWFGVRRRLSKDGHLVERYREAGRKPPNEFICSGLVQEGFVDGVLDFVRRGLIKPHVFREIVFDPELEKMMGDDWSEFSHEERVMMVESFAELYHDDLLSVRPVDLAKSRKLNWCYVVRKGQVFRTPTYEASREILRAKSKELPLRRGDATDVMQPI